VLFIKNIVSASRQRPLAPLPYHRLETVFVLIILFLSMVVVVVVVPTHNTFVTTQGIIQGSGSPSFLVNLRKPEDQQTSGYNALYAAQTPYIHIHIQYYTLVHSVVWCSCIYTYTNNLVPVLLLHLCVCMRRGKNAAGQENSPGKRHSISNTTKT